MPPVKAVPADPAPDGFIGTAGWPHKTKNIPEAPPPVPPPVPFEPVLVADLFGEPALVGETIAPDPPFPPAAGIFGSGTQEYVPGDISLIACAVLGEPVGEWFAPLPVAPPLSYPIEIVPLTVKSPLT